MVGMGEARDHKCSLDRTTAEELMEMTLQILDTQAARYCHDQGVVKATQKSEPEVELREPHRTRMPFLNAK